MIKAGFAECTLSVPPGQPMMGHTRDNYSATGTHDPLLCKTIVWQQGGQIVGIVVLDLCMVDARLADEAKEKISERVGIAGESFLICATHTHSGPAVFSLYEAPVMDKDVRDAMIKTIVKTVRDAWESRRTVSLRYGTATCAEQIGFYRRLRHRDGATVMNWESVPKDDIIGPWGTFDAKVKVLEMTGEDMHLCLINFPLHPAILDYTNSLYSRDYPGYMEKALKQMAGEPLQVIFVNGMCGNINHIDYSDSDMPRRGYAASQRVGYVLASAVMEALRTAEPLASDGVGKVIETVRLERIDVPGELAERAERTVEESRGNIPSVTDGLPFELQAPLIARLAKVSHIPLEVRLSVTKVGNLYLFGFPGEMTYELQKMLEKALGGIPLMAIELADDAVGYIAHREAYDQGGYETQVGATRVSAGSGERLVEQAIELFERLCD